jgi:3-oxoacyl-(acyl-carrier-protein) synthase
VLRRPDLANANAANQDAMGSIEIVKSQSQFPRRAGIEPGDVIAADSHGTATVVVDVRELPACRRPVRGQGRRNRDRDRQQGQRG